jgi:hypothetical protein
MSPRRERQHRLSQQLLQLAVLVLQGLQALGIRYLEAAVLGLPFEERGAADPLLAADVGRLGSGLLLAQDPDDLLFCEPARLHVHPLPGDGLYPFLEDFAGLTIRPQRVERGHVLARRFVPVWVRAVRGFHAGFAPNAFICTVRPDAC